MTAELFDSNDEHIHALAAAVQTAIDAVRNEPESLAAMRQLLEQPFCRVGCVPLVDWLKDALFDNGVTNERTLQVGDWSEHAVVRGAELALTLNRFPQRPAQARLTTAFVDLTCSEALNRLRRRIVAEA